MTAEPVSDLFAVTTSPEPAVGRVRMAVRGELDLSTAATLVEAFDQVSATSPAEVELDASGLTFCDSSGIGAFLTGAKRCADDGIALRIVGLRPSVCRAFELCGVTDMFDLEPEQDS